MILNVGVNFYRDVDGRIDKIDYEEPKNVILGTFIKAKERGFLESLKVNLYKKGENSVERW